MTEESISVAQVFNMMPSRFNAAEAEGIDATYQFDLTGDDGGTYHVTIAEGSCEVHHGAAEAPDTTIIMAAPEYLNMISGKLAAPKAFMSGKLKVKGDMGLAMKMQQIFPTDG